MASLAHCIDLHKTLFPKEEMVALRSESRRLAMEKKITPKEAMVQVVRSRIAETQIEYDKIAAVVREHYRVPEKKVPEKKVPEKKVPEKKVPEKKAVSHIDLVKRYVEETGKKVEEGELDKVKARYPVEWAKIEEAETHKKELWNKLPESFRRNRGINEYTTKELEAMVAERESKIKKEPVPEIDDKGRAIELAKSIIKKRIHATTKDTNTLLALAKKQGISHKALFIGDDPATRRIVTDYIATLNLEKGEDVSALKTELLKLEKEQIKLARDAAKEVPGKIGVARKAHRANKLAWNNDRIKLLESLIKKYEAKPEKDVKFSVAAPMYSALTRAAEAPKFPAKQAAKSVINQLKKASGVKQVEIDVVGLAEWLEGKDKVTKADVVNFLRMNEVRVEEVERGKIKGEIEAKGTERFTDKFEEWLEAEHGLNVNELEADRIDEFERLFVNKEKDVLPTKFAEHVLPGGEPGSYRELVLRVPDRYKAFPEFAEWSGMDEAEFSKKTKEEQSKLQSRYYAEKDKALGERYISPHWPEDVNTIAHIRGDVRTVDGKRLFHVAEFQSDIYSRIVELEAKVAEPPTIKWQIFYADGTALGGPFSNEELARSELAGVNKGRTTDLLTLKQVEGKREWTGEDKELANLKKLFPWGEMWHELVAKKALEYAVKNDLDGISWDTAKTQVDRWESALRKSVDKIDWSKGWRDGKDAHISGVKDGGQVFMEQVPLQGETTIEGQRVTLNNLIGKELATKIRESSETSGTFEGKDLTIGGEFYKIIYDQKIPGFLKRYGKKWGAKVEKSEMITGGEGRRFKATNIDTNYVTYVDAARASELRDLPNYKIESAQETIHTMTITPAMKEAIQASGQALFAERAVPGKKLTVDTAKNEIASRIGKKALNAMIGAKKIQFVTLDEVAEIIGYARTSKDQGFYKDGIVYLIPENIGEGKAWGVLMHELGVHLGYNKIFGEKLAKEVFAAFVANNGKGTPLGLAVSKAMSRVPYRTRPDLVNEEAVAYFTEEHANIKLSLHRKIIARMRLWAVKYFGVKPDVFVMDDYVALAASAMRGEIREARRMPVREGVSREVFYSEISKFSVPEMPVEEAAEKITDNPNFVRWFGDSKVVDKKGEPLVVYHGTKIDITEFDIAKSIDGGFHFGTSGQASMRIAGEGKRIMPVYLSINDLQRSKDSGGKWKSQIKTAKKYGKDGIVYLNRYEGITLESIKIAEQAGINPDKLNDKKFKEWFPEAQDSYIVFEPTQIKTIFNIGTFDPTKADIRYSVAEQKDLLVWADDLIKSAKNDSFVLDTQKTSPKEIRASSIKILADLNLKELGQPARSFLEGMSPRGKGIGRVIEKWLASPEWYQHPVLKKIVGHALNKSERFHTMFNEFNAVDDPMAEHDTVAKTLEALARKGEISKAAFIMGKTSADFKKLEILLDDADVYSERHTTESLKEKGYSEDVIQCWSVVRESYDKQLEALIKPMKDLVARIKEQAAFMGTEPIYPDFGDFIIEGKKRRLSLQEAVMEMGRYKGTYSPRIRDKGAWVITGHIKKTVAEGGDEYVRYNRKTKSFANLLRDKLAKEGFTDIKIEKESRLPEETFQAVRMAEMGTMISHAASKGLDKYDGEQQMAFMDEVVTASADLIKSRGARATMIRRREGLAVRGYLTDPLKRFVRYTGTNAAGIAKAEMAEGMIRDLYGTYKDGKKVGGIDAAKEGDVHSMARAYIEEQLRNAETGDRIVGAMKALTTFKFLGFNPRSVLVNMSSLTTSVPVVLHTRIMKGKGSLLRIGKFLSIGCKDYTKVMAGRRLKNIDEQIFIDEFRANGYTDAQFTRDAMGNVQGAYGTAWSKLMGGSMYVFGKSEEWVRGGTALAAYRLGKKQGWSHVKANEQAVKATSEAHGIYGKETLPMVAWGKGVGRLGQAFYTYLKFPHNYLQMLYDTGIRKKNIKGVIFGMAAPAVLGGIKAVPMYATIMAIANAMMSATGDDRDAEKLVYDTLNEYTGKRTEETVRGGVLGLLDIDISGSLSMGPGSIPTSLFELTGAVGGMVQDIYRGVGYTIEGEYMRAFEKLMPKAVGNIALAIRETREGATTSRGDRVWDEEGQPYMPEPSETAKRAMGFRSTRRAILAQSTWVSKREERRFKETQSSIYRKIKYLTAGAENVIIDKETSDKISEYNKNALQTSNVPLITPASIERQMERMKTPTTKQKARVTGCERVARFEGSIWAGALGVTDEMDRTQSEVKRLSDLGILKYSAPPSRNINAGYGIKVKLDDDQYSRYVADTSTMIKEATDRLVARPEWQGWTDKQRAFVVKRVINEGRKIVRDRIKITILKARLKKE